MTGSLERRAGGEWGLTPDGINGDRDALGRITKKTEWIVASDAPETGARPLDARTYVLVSILASQSSTELASHDFGPVP